MGEIARSAWLIVATCLRKMGQAVPQKVIFLNANVKKKFSAAYGEEGGGGSDPGIIGPFSFYIFAHIHVMVLIYKTKCSPFNMLSNSMFYLPIHLFMNCKLKCTTTL